MVFVLISVFCGVWRCKVVIFRFCLGNLPSGVEVFFFFLLGGDFGGVGVC